jgi:hypothetical protein
VKVEKFFEFGRVEGWKEKTGVRTNVSHASEALAAQHVCSDGGDGNGGMPAKSWCDWTVWI